MAIHFKCKKCKKTIIRDEKKYGAPVRCSDCQTVNKTPSIAFQSQASQQQLELMHKSLIRHQKALWVFYILLPIFIIVAAYLHSSLIVFPLGLIVFIAALLLLDRTSKSSKYLGRSPVIVFIWFVIFSLVFFIMSITSYMRLKKRLAILVEAGSREG